MKLTEEDKARIRAIDIEQVALALGIEVVRHKALCPFHDDHHPSLYFNPKSNTYRCYACDAHGDTIALAREHEGWGFVDACRWLAATFNIPLDNDNAPQPPLPKAKPMTPRTAKDTDYEALPVDTAHLEALLRRPWLSLRAQQFLFDERHISPEVVKRLGISSIVHATPTSSDPKSMRFNAPSLLLPYRDEQGRLLTVQARLLVSDDGRPRFQFPRGGRCSIFNQPQLSDLQPGDELWITEGVSDCLAMLTNGRKAIAVPSATILKQTDIAQIRQALERSGATLHISPDNDEAGQELCRRLQEAFPQMTVHPLPHGIKDYADLHRQTAQANEPTPLRQRRQKNW